MHYSPQKAQNATHNTTAPDMSHWDRRQWNGWFSQQRCLSCFVHEGLIALSREQKKLLLGARITQTQQFLDQTSIGWVNCQKPQKLWNVKSGGGVLIQENKLQTIAPDQNVHSQVVLFHIWSSSIGNHCCSCEIKGVFTARIVLENVLECWRDMQASKCAACKCRVGFLDAVHNRFQHILQLLHHEGVKFFDVSVNYLAVALLKNKLNNFWSLSLQQIIFSPHYSANKSTNVQNISYNFLWFTADLHTVQ